MDVVWLTIATILASIVGTVTGFGASTVLMPIAIWLLPFPQALLLVGIIHFAGDVGKTLLFRAGIRWRLLAVFSVPGIVAGILGARFSFLVPEETLIRLLGVLLVAYVGFLIAVPQFRLKERDATAAAGGALSGFLAGLTGFGGAARSAVLVAFDLPKSVYIVMTGIIGLTTDAARLVTYLGGGTRLPERFTLGLGLLIPASFLGAWIGRRFAARIPQKRFRLFIALFLLAIGVKLVIAP